MSIHSIQHSLILHQRVHHPCVLGTLVVHGRNPIHFLLSQITTSEGETQE
jgi:hypothetical protein